MKFISKFALLFVIAAILYLLLSGNLLSASPVIITLQLLALALSIWARRTFLKGQFSIHANPGEGPLLQNGPYKFIRHPMYTFALIIVWSATLGHWSLLVLIISLLVTSVALVRILTEEEFLRAKYPEYVRYASKTKRLIPFII